MAGRRVLWTVLGVVGGIVALWVVVVAFSTTEIGRPPVSTAFTYHGTRKVQLTKHGFETLTVTQKSYLANHE